MGTANNRTLPLVLGFGLAAAFGVWCIYLLRADIARIPVAAALRAWDVVLLATALSLLNYALRALRWRGYLAKLGHRTSFGFAVLTYIAGFALTLSPAKLGEMARARYYLERGVPLRDTGAAFFAERLLDVVAMLVLASFIVAASNHYNGALLAVAVGLAAVVIALVAVPWDKLALAVSDAKPHSQPGRLQRRVRTGLAGTLGAAAAARALMGPTPIALGLLLGLAAWACEGLGLWVLAFGFVPGAIGPVHAIGIYAVAVLIGAISFLPGGLGSTEAVMTALLAGAGFPLATAFLVTMLCRIVTLWFAVGLGWGAVALLRDRAPVPQTS